MHIVVNNMTHAGPFPDDHPKYLGIHFKTWPGAWEFYADNPKIRCQLFDHRFVRITPSRNHCLYDRGMARLVTHSLRGEWARDKINLISEWTSVQAR